jgi:hypothetical protein
VSPATSAPPKRQSFARYHVRSLRMNWRTALVGLVSTCAAYVAMFPEGFAPNVVNVARFVMVGGFAAFGIVGKDASTTGTAHDPQPRAPTSHAKGRGLETHAYVASVPQPGSRCSVCGKFPSEHEDFIIESSQ